MQRVYLYYAAVTDADSSHQLYPGERMAEINACKNEIIRREKCCAWEMLKYAVTDALSLKFDNLQFAKLPSGQWICEECAFSISHSDDAVVVAVSERSVGVDVEGAKAIDPRLAEKVLTASELKRYSDLNDVDKTIFLLETWCKKEAIFKAIGGSALLPKTIECDTYHTEVKRVRINDREYLIAVAANESFEIEDRGYRSTLDN